MNQLMSIVVLFSLAFFATFATVTAADKPASPVPADAKCPVCGMFAAKYPEWSASARFKDGTVHYFDGPKDLFKYYLDTARYSPGKITVDISTLAVKEYYSLEMIDPRSAFFVIGSDIHGPMGSELIPFKTEKDAAAFKLDHKGKRIIRFGDVTRHLIKALD
ncbi:MAG: nitrous oxide reductase accessory protein NosL [Desulfuromonadales bacterium]